MNNKGFTLIELLVVIAILGLSIGFVAINFNAINGTKEDIETQSIAKDIAEAAYVLIDNEDDNQGLIKYDKCYDARNCLKEKGYISKDQGLLDECDDDCLKQYYFKVTNSGGQKIVKVYKVKNGTNTTNTCTEYTNKCTSGNDTNVSYGG